MSTGFTFGAKPQQPSLFGAQTSAPTFGSAAPAFGTQPTTFTSQPVGSITFGTPLSTTQTSTTPQFGLGTNLNQPSQIGGGLQFGSTTGTGLFGSTTTAISSAAPLSFKPPTTSAFGTLTTSTTGGGGGLTFGSTPASLGGGLSFGTSQTSTGGLSFGTGTPLSNSAAAAPTAAATNTSFLGSSGGLSFGVSAPSSTTPSLGLNFGAVSSAAPTLNFGAVSSAAPTLNFGLSTAGSSSFSSFQKTTATTSTATTSTPSVGLGGIATQVKSGTSTGQLEVLPKNQTLPNEIQQTVDNFKKFVAEQKSFSSDVARYSVKEFKKVEEDINMANNILNNIENQLQNNLSVAEKLKHDTAKGLKNIEMAQRTHETPPGLQYENVAPVTFFIELADSYEKEMLALKLQIENTDRFLKNMGSPSALTSQDLAMGMKRLHETFVALAGRLQYVHGQVETQKEQYLSLRKTILNDETNVFEAPGSHFENFNITVNNLYTPPKNASGPSPFSNTEHSNFIANVSAQNPPSAYPASTFGPTPTPQLSFGTTNPQTNLFGSSAPLGQQFNTSLNTNFQLQKPPVGNKRG